MSKIHVYHISQTDLGPEVMLKPQVPEFRAPEEDGFIPRICCCTSITNCIMAIGSIPYTLTALANDHLDLWLYEAEVYTEDIIQPTEDQVDDVWMTGELWIIRPYKFVKTKHYVCRKHMDVSVVYSRFSFTSEHNDEVVDRVCSEAIYGDKEAFSMIMMDPYKRDLFLKGE